MLNGFENETSPLTDYEREEVLPAVAGILRTRVGSRTAVTNKTIVRMLGGEKISETRVRKVINHIRLNDIVPCLVATSNGCYIAESEEELVAYEESLRGREDAIREVRISINRQRTSKYGLACQGTLF